MVGTAATESHYHVYEPSHFTSDKPPEGISSEAADKFKALKPHISAQDKAEIRGAITEFINATSRDIASKVKNDVGSPEAASGKTWPWVVGTAAISVAVTALIVWAIMHSHDKKLLAQIASANSQNNGGQ